MKKAFTFAELMISLVVISVLSAILYPTIAQFNPNSNKPLFKSAYRTLINIIYEIVNESDDHKLPTENNKLCEAFCKKANVITETATDDTCATLCADNTITTTNGMRWKFGNYSNTYTDPFPRNGSSTRYAIGKSAFRIYVDVNSSNNDLAMASGAASAPYFATGAASGNGVFYYEATTNTNHGVYKSGAALPNYSSSGAITKEDFNIENLKNQDTFEIIIDEKGKILSMSPAAWANLEDNLQAPD